MDLERVKYLGNHLVSAEKSLEQMINTHYLLYTSQIGVLEYQQPRLPNVGFLGALTAPTGIKGDKQIWAWLDQQKSDRTSVVFVHLKDPHVQNVVLESIRALIKEHHLSMSILFVNATQREQVKTVENGISIKKELPTSAIASEAITVVISEGNLFTVNEAIVHSKLQLIIPNTNSARVVAERLVKHNAALQLYPQGISSSLVQKALSSLIVNARDVHIIRQAMKKLNMICRSSHDGNLMRYVNDVINMGESYSKFDSMHQRHVYLDVAIYAVATLSTLSVIWYITTAIVRVVVMLLITCLCYRRKTTASPAIKQKKE